MGAEKAAPVPHSLQWDTDPHGLPGDALSHEPGTGLMSETAGPRCCLEAPQAPFLSICPCSVPLEPGSLGTASLHQLPPDSQNPRPTRVESEPPRAQMALSHLPALDPCLGLQEQGSLVRCLARALGWGAAPTRIWEGGRQLIRQPWDRTRVGPETLESRHGLWHPHRGQGWGALPDGLGCGVGALAQVQFAGFLPVTSTRSPRPPWPGHSQGSLTSLWSRVSLPVVTSKTGRGRNP